MRPQEKYDKENMAIVRGKYKKEFVEEFKQACIKLDLKQSHVFKDAMIKTIEKAKKEGK